MVDRADTIRVNFDLNRDDYTNLKIHAPRAGRSVVEILRELATSVDES